MHGNCHMIGNVTTATVRCCWKRLWMGTAFAAPVTERPTGSMWDRPPGAAVWIGSTRLTVRQSKISTPIRWCVTHGSSYAAILCGKQIQPEMVTPNGLGQLRVPTGVESAYT